MGKTYIDTVKYLVYANVDIGGMIEKPDVVGAIFGQTEGLLGDELDLRELQKNGRIGRIEVDLNVKGGRSIGRITLPSSLDMVETSILAAALESVDRVGPCDAKINVEKIEDTRSVKRKAVIDRAKALLMNLITHEIPESKEISELVRQEVKVAEIGEYGPEKLPAGPNITGGDAIVIVEGRADVLNLLKNDVNNAIAVGGANVPKSILGLCEKKEVTVFLDGDRGGDIILRELANAAELDFVARAPAGKEVEELSRKEIIKCLRSRIPADQVLESMKRERERDNNSYDRRGGRFNRFERGNSGGGYRDDRFQRDERQQPRVEQQEQAQQTLQPPVQQIAEGVARPQLPAQQDVAEPLKQQSSQPREDIVSREVVKPPAREEAGKAPQALLDSLKELENTLKARMYDAQFQLKNEIPVRDLIKSLSEGEAPHAIVFDGIITQRLVDLADSKGTKILVGVKVGNVFKKPASITIQTK
ncbi:DNA primase [Candidatus Micrarchaeota archaeon]|nr:DNA primase [Candidatus Micrarchaeota archaeon]